jgi:hypothetical protein
MSKAQGNDNYNEVKVFTSLIILRYFIGHDSKNTANPCEVADTFTKLNPRVLFVQLKFGWL